MKSPRFDARAAPLRKIFTENNLAKVWRKKVRASMKQQFLVDGIEHFDFHVQCETECQKLSTLILSGEYVPGRAQRILVEKSRGLCRQLVIPNVADAVVLQCLSDALYHQIKEKAPTNRSFFEPQDHRFTVTRNEYGAFAAWLNFQRTLFQFSKERPFVVVTDIANYYDTISYTHLRNVISGIAHVEECVLDMLIFVLSYLLWQPDYSPRVEVGLPQMNLDAPRLLAHCFLYEVDKYLSSSADREFVRYMDDIDIGVDSIVSARRVLQSVDLVLQARQVRLNSGKTQILTREQAARHFRIFENYQLDRLSEIVARRLKAKGNLDRLRKLVSQQIHQGLARGKFDGGNGDKILKRWLGLAGKTKAGITDRNVSRIILLRPSVRENVMGYVAATRLTPARISVIADCIESGHLVDDAAVVDICNSLVETSVDSRRGRHTHLMRIVAACDPFTYFGLYAKMWMQSKYCASEELLETIIRTRRLWAPHEQLGRIVGAFLPLFSGTILRII